MVSVNCPNSLQGGSWWPAWILVEPGPRERASCARGKCVIGLRATFSFPHWQRGGFQCTTLVMAFCHLQALCPVVLQLTTLIENVRLSRILLMRGKTQRYPDLRTSSPPTRHQGSNHGCSSGGLLPTWFLYSLPRQFWREKTKLTWMLLRVEPVTPGPLSWKGLENSVVAREISPPNSAVKSKWILCKAFVP